MTNNADAGRKMGFMKRLASNQEGNIIAIMAAAVIPVIGLVGGAVDMSRLYLTQSRLQGACDAGALIGRKTMGVSTWAANSNAANTRALQMFDQNFQSGAYGSNSLARRYTESGGNVVGTASTTVPMALMQVLGQEAKTVSVRCQAELRIPNTDVMFVLDTTGSMDNPILGATETKISGLRRAVKCFYEALAKNNVTDISPADCGETADPVNNNSVDVQLRFGFVPYASNVNVGRLLPQDYMVDQWTYQSRQAVMTNTANVVAIYGPQSAPVTISAVDTAVADSNWSNTNQNIVQNGITYNWYTVVTPANCPTAAPTGFTGSTVGANILVSQTPAQPADPDALLTRDFQQTTSTFTRAYRYFFTGDKTKPNQKGGCLLQLKDTARSTRTASTRTTTPISWDREQIFSGWRYSPVTFNVSSLKGSNGVWETSLSLPLGSNGAMTSVFWNGCIEERQTFRGTDSDPSDDWNPVPATAFDMNIDLIPTSDVSTKWAPMLTSAVWERFVVETAGSGAKSRSTTRTLDDVFVSNSDSVDMTQSTSNCPSESRKVQAWTPDNFGTYVNAMSIGGNTYHDIGLLWGARIMSPTGIFSQLNAPLNKSVERHMVFMTDGETNVEDRDYAAYGVHWYDRRQTPSATAPTNAQLNTLSDARTAALCSAIKNRNINLWVVSYGDVASTTNDRLRACATPGKFFQATSVANLITNFKAIAAEISALRLTE